MSNPVMPPCPVCQRPAQIRTRVAEDTRDVDCDTCGHYTLDEDAPAEFDRIIKKIRNARALISYCIRQAQRSNDRPLIDDVMLRAFAEHNTLPSPPEQGDNLIRCLGDALQGDDPSREKIVAPPHIMAVLGASSPAGVHYVANELERHGLVRTETPYRESGQITISLTFIGWQRYAELKRAHSEGPVAFMAMPFNVSKLDEVYMRCFRPAVQQTGFELRRLDHSPPAGLIDVRMEVEIRRSRFLIAELTNENRGVYWEAGFAEGLGKPVIYTCEQTYFDQNRTHFDTNHRHTIVWIMDQLDEMASALKNTIRATLPSEARMSDPE